MYITHNDNGLVTPQLRVPAPLQCKHKTGDGTRDQSRSDEV